MPPRPFLDLSTLDLNTLAYDRDAVRERNPHRHEFDLLHGIISFQPDEGLIVGVHQASDDAFWVRGHIPGRPLFPGVLMVEIAAQLCSFYWREAFPDVDKFFGFGGIQDTKFRGSVQPGDRLVLIGKSIEVKPRARPLSQSMTAFAASDSLSSPRVGQP